eukprot:scaffold1301_cov135-Isochrysis_galbana.AAC.7
MAHILPGNGLTPFRGGSLVCGGLCILTMKNGTTDTTRLDMERHAAHGVSRSHGRHSQTEASGRVTDAVCSHAIPRPRRPRF